MNTPKINLICGVARSGTTFTREIVRRARRGLMVEEAMNLRYGVVNLPIVYPYVPSAGGQYAPLIDEIVSFSRPWKKRLAAPEHWSTFNRIIYRTIGSKWRIQWQMLRLSKHLRLSPESILWKDPFASLSTPYLISRYDVRVACMIRHPAAVYVSMQRRHWGFNIEHLRRQPELMQAYGNEIAPSYWESAKSSAPAAIAILWKIVSRLNSELAANGGGRLLLVRHEDLCLDPMRVATRVIDHFGIETTPSARRFLIRSTRGDKVVGTKSGAHDFVRNSNALVDDWRRRISPQDEKTIRNIVGDDYYRIYSQW